MRAQMERSSHSDLFNSRSDSCAKDESRGCPWNLSSGTFERSSAKRHSSHISKLRDEWQLRHASQLEDMPAPCTVGEKMMVARPVVGIRSWDRSVALSCTQGKPLQASTMGLGLALALTR